MLGDHAGSTHTPRPNLERVVRECNAVAIGIQAAHVAVLGDGARSVRAGSNNSYQQHRDQPHA